MEFVVDDPPAAEDSDTQASTIHNYIQDAKTMIRERMEANNDDFYAHYDFSEDDWGKHQLSRIAFVSVHDNVSDVDDDKLIKGTLKYIKGVNDETEKGLYVVNNNGEMEKTGVTDHSLLDDLEDADAHTQYLLIDGTRQMSGSLTLGEQAEPTIDSYGSGDTDPLEQSHVDKSWEDAHGDGSVDIRHVEDEHLWDGNFNRDNTDKENSDELSETTYAQTNLGSAVYTCNMTTSRAEHSVSDGTPRIKQETKLDLEGKEESLTLVTYADFPSPMSYFYFYPHTVSAVGDYSYQGGGDHTKIQIYLAIKHQVHSEMILAESSEWEQ